MTDPNDEQQTNPLALLLALQDADLQSDQLVHHIEHHPVRIAERALESRRAELTKRSVDLDASAAVYRTRQAELELEVAAIEHRVLTIEERMRSIAAGSFRDQEAMVMEIQSLLQRKSELEDEELGAMEALEPIDAELSRIGDEDRVLAEELAQNAEELRSAVAELDMELEALREARPLLVENLPSPLFDEYERLRTRLGGIGAARVVRGSCSGCNLSLSSTELDHLRHAPPGAVSHCEQCGRILVA
jgi:predicted  nucleic acid-binding Zn-ribbon protein